MHTQPNTHMPQPTAVKTYNAILTATGTDNPTPTVLGQNTIGNIAWTYFDTGTYKGTLTGAFPTGKTLLFATESGAAGSALAVMGGRESSDSDDYIYLYGFDETYSAFQIGTCHIRIEIYT